MNIFFLDTHPSIAASYHNDRHVVKMTLETAQILSSALYKNGILHDSRLYKPTHKNHPCVLWAAESEQNFIWLCYLGLALGREYTSRFGKVHKSISVIEYCKSWSFILPNIDLSKPPQCMPEQYREESTVMAYRNYYKSEKRFPYSVTPPEFMQL